MREIALQFADGSIFTQPYARCHSNLILFLENHHDERLIARAGFLHADGTFEEAYAMGGETAESFILGLKELV